MKLLFLSDDFPPQSFGGAGIVAFNLAKALYKLGHSVSVITAVQDKKDEGIVEYEGLKIYRVYTNYPDRFRSYLSLYNPQTVERVKKIIHEITPEIVHSHNIHYFLSYHCLKLAKQSGAKVFLTAHDVMLFHYGKLVEFIDPKDQSCPNKFNYKISPWQQIKTYKKRYNPLRNIIIKYYLKNVDKIFAVSNALKDALNQNGIDNVEVVHNGIDVAEWEIPQKDVDEFKIKYNLINKKVILFGGRLSNAKGGYQAIAVMKEVLLHRSDVVMLILGNKNQYVESCIKIAEELGIVEKLIFTGWISGNELKSAYKVSNLVLVPSVCFDCFPTTNLEALVCRKPIIATCFGGSRELVEDGKTGYIVNPYDIQNFADKILEILCSTQLAETIGEYGYRRVKEQFSLQMQTKNVLFWYNQKVHR